MKRHPRDWKLIYFIIGNVILIGTTWVISFYTPNRIWEIDSLDDRSTQIDNAIWEKQMLMRDYELWDSKYINIKNTMYMLETLNQAKSVQYQALIDELKSVKLIAVKKLAEAAGVKHQVELNKKWKTLDSNQLEDEKQRLLRENPSIIKALLSEKSYVEDRSSDKLTEVTFANFITAILQTIALSILTFSEILYRKQP